MKHEMEIKPEVGSLPIAVPALFIQPYLFPIAIMNISYKISDLMTELVFHLLHY